MTADRCYPAARPTLAHRIAGPAIVACCDGEFGCGGSQHPIPAIGRARDTQTGGV